MFHFAIVSNSASRLFSTGSSLHLALLPSWHSLRFSIRQLCVPLKCGLQVMRVSGLPRLIAFTLCVNFICAAGVRRPCGPKKGSQFAARLVARYRRSQFYNNKNFVSKQIFICLSTWNVYILCRTGIRVILLLSYMFTGKFFLCFCLKFFGKFFLKDWGFKGHKQTP